MKKAVQLQKGGLNEFFVTLQVKIRQFFDIIQHLTMRKVDGRKTGKHEPLR